MAVSALLTRELGFSEVIEAHSFDEATEYLRVHPEVAIAILNFSNCGDEGRSRPSDHSGVLPGDEGGCYFELEFETEHPFRHWNPVCMVTCPRTSTS